MSIAKGLVLAVSEKRRIKDRFLSYVSQGPSSVCWDWLGAKHPAGYGHFAVTKGDIQIAHRVSYVLFKGPIPDEVLVLHSCNRPSCVNFNHLKLGTHQDNVNDSIEAGTFSRGAKHTGAKLSEAQVIGIKQRLRDGDAGKDIAECFNVVPSTIAEIKAGRNWKHVTLSAPNEPGE
jgi:hypothetical protein